MTSLARLKPLHDDPDEEKNGRHAIAVSRQRLLIGLCQGLSSDRCPTVVLLIVLMHSRRDRDAFVVRSECLLTASCIIPIWVLSRCS
jgi:hypothetical protein